MNRDLLEIYYKEYETLKILSESFNKAKKTETKIFFQRLVLNDKTRKYILEKFSDLRLENNSLIFGKETLLTNNALTNDCINQFFAKQIHYKCNNEKCPNIEGVGSDNVLLICPLCKAKFSIDNVVNTEKLQFNLTFFLCNYDFFYIEDEDKTKYLIFDKITKNYFVKQGKSNLKEWLYNKFKHDLFLRKDLNYNFIRYYGLNKTVEAALFDFFQENIIPKFVSNINFKPIKSLLFEDEEKLYFNTFKGNKYLNMEKKAVRKGFDFEKKCPSIHKLLFNLVSFETEALDYLLKILAFQIQFPYIRTGKVIVFFGEEQSGKGTFYKQIYQQLFKGYCCIQNQKILDEPFNHYLSNRLGVFYDETSYNKDHEDQLKNQATEDEIHINTKFGRSGVEKVYFTTFAFSNNDLPLKVGERRGVYFRCKTLGGDKAKSASIGVKLNNKIPEEIDDFAKYLWSLDVSFEEINQGYSTQAKKDILEATKSIEDEFLAELFSFENLDDFTTKYNTNVKNIFVNEYLKKGWLEVNFFLDCYNVFRYNKNKKYSNISLKSFNWFFQKLDIDKKDAEAYKRGINNYNQNVFYINMNEIKRSKEVYLL